MLEHHDIAILLVQLASLLAVARGLGEICKRLGQPAVIGELLAGILLGKAGLGALGVSFFYSVSEGVRQSLATMSLIGLILLLLLTGLETDFALIRRNIKSALLVSVGGLIIPLLSGYTLGMMLPQHLAGRSDTAFVLPAFLAVCMGISALPVIGKVLLELNIMRRTVAQTLIAAAMIEDATGWIILSVILAVVEKGTFSLWQLGHSIALVVGFLVVSLTAGRHLVVRAMRLGREHFHDGGANLSLVMTFAFLWAALAQSLGLESIFGAFIFGLLLGLCPSLNNDIVHVLHAITLNVFAPLFFALAGLRVDVAAAFQGEALLATILIFMVAVGCKTIGGYLGGRYLAKMSVIESVFVGVGLNARGSMGVIVATIGLSVGVFSPTLFASVVVMAIATSLMAPPALRWAATRIPLASEEADRLTREGLEKDGFLAQTSRILIPVRFRDDLAPTAIHLVEAQLVERLAAKKELSITLLTNVARGQESRAQEYLTAIGSLFPNCRITKKVVVSGAPGNVILEEASRRYDLLIMGTPQGGGGEEQVFTPLIDYVARLSPCPVLFVRGPRRGAMATRWQRILVPTNGSSAAQRAANFAFAVSKGSAAADSVRLLNIVESSDEVAMPGIMQRQMSYAREHLGQLQTAGDLLGATVAGEVLVGHRPEEMIVEYAVEHRIDLIILGISVRSGSERLFLGPRVEHIIERATCSVVVLNS